MVLTGQPCRTQNRVESRSRGVENGVGGNRRDPIQKQTDRQTETKLLPVPEQKTENHPTSKTYILQYILIYNISAG